MSFHSIKISKSVSILSIWKTIISIRPYKMDAKVLMHTVIQMPLALKRMHTVRLRNCYSKTIWWRHSARVRSTETAASTWIHNPYIPEGWTNLGTWSTSQLILTIKRICNRLANTKDLEATSNQPVVQTVTATLLISRSIIVPTPRACLTPPPSTPLSTHSITIPPGTLTMTSMSPLLTTTLYKTEWREIP